MMTLNIDGFGHPTHAIHPEYLEYVKAVQPWGVFPKFGNGNLDQILADMSELEENIGPSTRVGVDYVRFLFKDDATQTIYRVGLGHSGGLLAETEGADLSCLLGIGYLNGMILRSLGINQVYGPTIEHHPHWGVLSQPQLPLENLKALEKGLRAMKMLLTYKHYPYTPLSFDLHRQNRDERLSPQEVYLKIKRFSAVRTEDMIMSTHVYNSQIDPDSLVTFSKKWVNQLRHLGFQGLLMSDALFMVKKYPATLGSIFKNLSEYQACGVDHFAAITASESLLSGHQIVMLESELKDTRRVLDQLKKLESCSTSLGLRFKKRVEDNQKDLQFFDQKYEMNFRKQRSVARLWKNEIKDALILLKLYEGKMRTREVCDLKKMELWMEQVAQPFSQLQSEKILAPLSVSLTMKQKFYQTLLKEFKKDSVWASSIKNKKGTPLPEAPFGPVFDLQE
jgi:hypothetical protein